MNAPTAVADHQVVDVVTSAYEVACLDIQGKDVGRPVETAIRTSRALAGTLEYLEKLIATMSNANPDGEEASQQADREFHLIIARASGNAAVQFEIETLWRMRTELPAIREMNAAVRAGETAKDRGAEHAEILIALRNRDAPGARTAGTEIFSDSGHPLDIQAILAA